MANASNLEWNHSKDIVFTSESLEEFIKLIKMHNTKHIHIYSVNGNGDYTASAYTNAPKIAVGNSTTANTAEFDAAEINALPKKGYNNYIAIVKDNIPWQAGATANVTSGRHTFIRVGNEVSLATGDNNGQVKITINGSASNVYVKGFTSDGYTGPFKPSGQNSTTFLRGDGSWSNTLTGSIWAGINGNTSGERDVGVQSGAGQMYMYSQASTGGDRGIWIPAHGSGAAKSVFSVDTNNNVTFNGSLNGNANSATTAGSAGTANKLSTARNIAISGAVTGNANFDGSSNITISTTVSHGHDYLPLSGGEVYGHTVFYTGTAGDGWQDGCAIQIRDVHWPNASSTSSDWSYMPKISFHANARNAGQLGMNSDGELCWYKNATIVYRELGTIRGGKVYGAVFNDYAEYRPTIELEPGRIVYDNDDGTLSCADKRLIPGAQVISDTFGFAIGETDNAKTPLAVSGRVLVYTYQPRENYHAGMAVCAAPDGTVDIMTREEIRDYPDCIVGIVSEIPQYEEWGSNNIKVNNRIWIKIK